MHLQRSLYVWYYILHSIISIPVTRLFFNYLKVDFNGFLGRQLDKCVYQYLMINLYFNILEKYPIIMYSISFVIHVYKYYGFEFNKFFQFSSSVKI